MHVQVGEDRRVGVVTPGGAQGPPGQETPCPTPPQVRTRLFDPNFPAPIFSCYKSFFGTRGSQKRIQKENQSLCSHLLEGTVFHLPAYAMDNLC